MKDFIIETSSIVRDESEADANEHVVLIAGDLAGTARAAAFAYAKEGNHIVIASGNDDAAMNLTDELRARHVDATFIHANSGEDLQRVVDITVKHYGHIDVQYRP